MRQALLVTTTLFTGLFSTPALAQDAAAPPLQAVDTPTGELSEIVVTAQRREESLQKAAIAVDVVTGGELANAGITSPELLATVVPSLAVMSNGGATTSFFLRGVGNFTNNVFTDPAVAFNYDGVYIGRPSSTAGMFYDLERIEVLKGPQGTLYGRNATGGAINVLPAKPKIGENSGFINAGYGNYDAINLNGAVNVSLGSNSAVRLAGSWTKHDGYLSDDTSDDDTVGLRAQFLTRPTDNFSLRIGATYSHVGGKGVGANYGTRVVFNPMAGSYTYVPTNFSRRVGVIDPAARAFRRTLDAVFPFGGRKLGPIPSGVFNDNTSYGANAEITYETDAGTITFIPAYQETQLDFWSPAFAGIADLKDKSKQTSLELRWAGNRIGIFDYILGAYYFDESVKGNDTIYQDAFSVYLDYKTKTESLAGFARVTAHLTDQLRLVGGVRYTHDKKSFVGTNETVFEFCFVGPGACPTAPVFPVTDTSAQLFAALGLMPAPFQPIGMTGAVLIDGPTPFNSRLKDGRFTYRAAAEFDIGPRSLLYASVEKGYRSGGFSPAIGRETYKPEFLTAYTIGMKNRLFDNRLQLNLEAFVWKYRDQQLAHFGIDGTGNGNQFTENIGKATNQGVEVDTQFLATPTTLLSATVQYLDAEYKNFTYTAPITNPPSTSCAVSATTFFTVDCSGKPALNSPKWTINLGAQQTVPVGDYKVVLAADTQYRSSRFVGFEFLDFQRARSVWRSSASIDFGPESERWSIGAYVRNIENNRTLLNSIIFPVGAVSTELTAAPRTYGVRASAKF